MEECESGKSAKWMRNFGISIGSKGERVDGWRTFVVGRRGKERGEWGFLVSHALHTTTDPTFFHPPPNHNHQFRTVTV